MVKRIKGDQGEVRAQRRHLFWLGIPLAVTLVVLQYKLWFGQGGYMDALRLERSITALEVRNMTLEARNDELKQRVQDLREREEAMEGAARRELGWVKSHETFFMVVEYADES